MPNVLIKDDNFVIAFDPEKIKKVTTLASGTVVLYGEQGDNWLIDTAKHPKAFTMIMKVLSEHFQVIDDDYDGSPEVTYRFEKTGLANWFKLAFPSQSEYDFAAELMEYETAFKFKPLDELYSMSVTFAPFYASFKENRQLIYDILGEPVNAEEGSNG
jgi:hypothetical protein